MDNIIELYQDLVNKDNGVGLSEADALIKLELENKVRARMQEFDGIIARANLRGLPIPIILLSESRRLKELLEPKSLGR